MTDAPDPRYAPPAAEAPPRDDEQKDALGWALVATPAIGGVLQVVAPGEYGSTLVAFLTILTAIGMIHADAQRRRQVPTPWIFGAFFLFAVTFPVYMHYRAKWGAPRRLGLALLSIAIYVAGFVGHAVVWRD